MSDKLFLQIKLVGEKILSSGEISFSNELSILIREIYYDDTVLIVAYFGRVDLRDDKVRSALIENFGIKIIDRIALYQRIGLVNIPDTRKKILGLREQFIELSDDISLIIIKLAERLVSLRFADKNNSLVLIQKSEECLYLYSPIAHRLGIRKIYTEMEDISFKHLYPADFKRLEQAIEKRRPAFEKKLNEMSRDLALLTRENGIQSKIQKRVKRLYSIFIKLNNKQIQLDQIFDLLALRVITNSPEKCYLTLGLVHRNWVPIEGRFRDWVTYPKPNGYRSIQTTVHTRKGDKFEIQIRTEEMHKEAEYGSAAHWAYKEGAINSDNKVNKLKEFLENDEYFNNPYELQELLKSELDTDSIHVLTPKGDIITLTKGSSVIDFAFAVHTGLGFRVTGGRVNGKFVKLKTILHSGDVVEVTSSNKATPSRDWLSFVASNKARSKITIWLKKNEMEKTVFEGRRIWDKLKKANRNKLEGVEEDAKFKSNLSAIGFKSIDDFYSALAIRSVKPTKTLLRKLFPEPFKKEHIRKDRVEKKFDENRIPKIKIEGLLNIQTKLAKCCNPIKGEPIIAYVTKHSEIKIHSTKCNYLVQFDKTRFKEATWLESESTQNIELRFTGSDYNEMLSYILDLSKAAKIELISTSMNKSRVNDIIILVEIEIKDINQLNHFIKMFGNRRIVKSVSVI